MSTILRALQRVEGEKSESGEMGALREGVVAPGEPLVRERGRHWRFGVTGSLVVILLGFFVWWMVPGEEASLPSDRSPAPVAAGPDPAPASSARSEGPPSRPHEWEVAAARPPAPVEEIRSSPPETVSMPEPLPVEEPAPRPSVEEAPAPADPAPWEDVEETDLLPPPRHLAREPDPPPPVQVAAVPPPAEEVPPLAEVAVQPPVRLAEPPAKVSAPPRVATLRPPKVTVQKTVWHPEPERRVARIEVEGRKGPIELHEGDAVGTLVVAEIQPSGVVFLHGGERLLRKVSTAR